MSTHSFIAVENPETGSLKAIYCHCDGDLVGVGRMLYEHYNSDELAKQLISMGAISALEKTIGERHPFDFKDRPKDVSTFYHRDRNEGAVPEIIKFKSRSAFSKYGFARCFYYLYIWDGRKWLYCHADHPGDVRFERISRNLARELRKVETRRAQRLADFKQVTYGFKD